MTWPIALKALFDGMINGMFTGKKLADYFNGSIDDPVGARRIVNGTDKAQLIAGYHKNFLDAIIASQDAVKAAEVEPEDAKPDDKPASQSAMALLSTAAPAAAGVALPALTGINNLYALVFMLVLLCVACGVGYMFLSGRFSRDQGEGAVTAAVVLFLKTNWLPILIVIAALAITGGLYLKGRSDGAAIADAAAKTAVVKQLKERNATDAKVESMPPPELCRAIGGVWRDNGCQ